MRPKTHPRARRPRRCRECPRGLRCSRGRADTQTKLLRAGTPPCASSTTSAAACAAAQSTRARGGAWQPELPRRALPVTPLLELPCLYPPSAGQSRGRSRTRSASTSWAAAAAVLAVARLCGQEGCVHIRAGRCVQVGAVGGVVRDGWGIRWPLGNHRCGCTCARYRLHGTCTLLFHFLRGCRARSRTVESSSLWPLGRWGRALGRYKSR